VIEYIVPNNIDERVIKRVARMLEDGALAALPTDTSWSIVCSLKSPAGIKKLRKLSGERDERHFTLLCSSISQFAQACDLDNTRFRLIKRLSPGPYVYILKALPGIGKILDIPRREVGVRIPNNPIPIKLIETLEQPLYSITAKKSMCKVEWETFDDEDSDTELPPIPENELFENGWELQEISVLDLIMDSGEERERIFSTIIDMCTDEIKLLRKGAGEWPV
jgi:tRNA threonylcarbamoyl adenosine modification protein (Sua5/YciO/YrdC/YwlC family)